VSAGEALDLLERAAFDLRQGWPEAALDAAARALRMLESEHAPLQTSQIGTVTCPALHPAGITTGTGRD
jgi:hypothetical protein